MLLPLRLMFAIETQSLTKKYGTRSVVDDVNLQVESGKVFGFLGPNGAGKTTTIRMLLGLVRPTAGKAKILKLDVSTEFTRIAPNIAAVVETPTFFPNLTTIQTLKTFADYSRLKKSASELHAILDTCGILYASKQKVDNFSLGMKQRLGLAVAILNDPKIIFLDEPTNGLDPDGISKTRKLIRYLADQEGKTIFVSSHLLAEVEQMCDEIVILNKGKIRAGGKVSDLLAGDKFCIKAAPLDKTEEVLKRFVPETKIERNGIHQEFYVSIESNGVSELIRGLVEAGVNVHEVSRKGRSLEDFFHQIVDSE